MPAPSTSLSYLFKFLTQLNLNLRLLPVGRRDPGPSSYWFPTRSLHFKFSLKVVGDLPAPASPSYPNLKEPHSVKYQPILGHPCWFHFKFSLVGNLPAPTSPSYLFLTQLNLNQSWVTLVEFISSSHLTKSPKAHTTTQYHSSTQE